MIELSLEQESIEGLAEALKYEENGKALRRDLTKAMKKAVDPALPQIRAGLMSMGTVGLPTQGPALRTTVLSKLRAQATLTGRRTGVRVSIGRTGMPRSFANAPKRLNNKKGWRHPVYGRDVWVHQVGAPEFFDRPLQERREEYRRAVMSAVDEMRGRIRAKTGG